MKRNIKIMAGISLLQGMVFYASVASLYRLEGGLTLFDISLIESVSYVLTVAFELPWGILADRIGYRRTLIICAFGYFVSKIIFWKANGFAWFLSERILLSFVFAGLSGTDSSLIYLSDPEHSQHSYGLCSAAGTAGMCVSSLIYALFIKEQYRLAGLCTVFPYGIAFVLSFFLTEVHPADRSGYDFAGMKTILTDILHSRRLLMLVAAGGIFSECIHLTTVFYDQPRYISAGIPVAVIGVLYIGMNLVSAVSVYSEKLTDTLGRKRIGILLPAVCTLAALVMTVSSSYIALPLSVAVLNIGYSLFMPLFQTLEQEAVTVKQRATALSILAVLSEFCCAVIDAGVGAVSSHSLTAALAACAALFALSAALISACIHSA